MYVNLLWSIVNQLAGWPNILLQNQDMDHVYFQQMRGYDKVAEATNEPSPANPRFRSTIRTQADHMTICQVILNHTSQ